MMAVDTGATQSEEQAAVAPAGPHRSGVNVALVVPRYGEEVIGGAEWGARMLAEGLVALRGLDVTVFTTCAVDYMTWEDEYPPGESVVNQVRVFRFPSERGRSVDFENFSKPVLDRAKYARMEEAEEWIVRQGPYNPELVDAVAESPADAVVFYPYLYYPTVFGITRVGRRAVLQPAAHDEKPLRLPIFHDVFRNAWGFAFHTQAERELVNRMFRVSDRPQIVIGLGIQPGTASHEAASAATGFDVIERPYLCCVGRVETMKGSLRLAEYFVRYKRAHPGPLALVYAGRVLEKLPKRSDIVTTGQVGEDAKWGIIASSLALVAPGHFESFSLTVLEALSVGVPVIVNGKCEATREHCERSGAGWSFGTTSEHRGYQDFERAVEELTAGERRAEMADSGRRYVESGFLWPDILERYEHFLEHVATRAVP